MLIQSLISWLYISNCGPNVDPYGALGVDEDTPVSEIVDKFRHLWISRHPEPSKQEKNKYEAILESYRLLINPRDRINYDFCRQQEKNFQVALVFTIFLGPIIFLLAWKFWV